MFCSISGTVPEHPVVSSKSGLLFEKSLIEKYVRETGKCPQTKEPLSLDDLLPIKTNKTVKPRTAPATSIPGLLSLFHDEWDASMLELHSMRAQLHQTRQELSHALYQHDAATRVIARLIRERDEARAALTDMRAQVRAELAAQQAADAEAAAAEPEAAGGRRPKAGIPEDIINDMTEVNATLSKGRKKRQLPDALPTPEDLAALSLSGSHPLHKTTAGGIVAIDASPQQPSLVVTAGMDSTLQLFDYLQTRVVASLEGHTKRCTGVQFISSDVLVSSSADKTARVWRAASGGDGSAYDCAAVLRDHSADVVGVTCHPSRRYFVTGSSDTTWAFYDLDTLTCLRQGNAVYSLALYYRSGCQPAGMGLPMPFLSGSQVSREDGAEPYTCVQFHPDGLILGTGTETKVVRIWEVKQQKNVASFEGHTSPIRALAFSENGYHLASCADDSVKLWDLRKLKNFKSLQPFSDGPCLSVAFDVSGQYLAVGGPTVRIYGQKQEWAEVASVTEVAKKALALRWGADARSLLVGAADHNLRVFNAPAAEAGKE